MELKALREKRAKHHKRVRALIRAAMIDGGKTPTEQTKDDKLRPLTHEEELFVESIIGPRVVTRKNLRMHMVHHT